MRRERTILKTGEKSVEYAYGITSVAAKCRSAKQLLAWNRGHWSIEVKNHLRRDKDLRQGRMLGAHRLGAGQPRDLQQHRTGGDSAPRQHQRGGRPAALYALPEGGIRGPAVSRLSRSPGNPVPNSRTPDP